MRLDELPRSGNVQERAAALRLAGLEGSAFVPDPALTIVGWALGITCAPTSIVRSSGLG